jgi:AAA domain/UvrD-like helicase C-terminal domain
MTADDTAATPVPLPDSETLRRHALKVAIYQARQEEARGNADAVRAAAELVFAPARQHGTPQVELTMPDGTKLGLISIQRGGQTVDVDEDLLTGIIAGNDPGDFEDFVKPSAVTDPRVLKLLAEHLPELVGRHVRPDAAALYEREIEENGGTVLDRAAGERVKVATITPHDATGKFSYRPAAKGAQLIREALELGTLTDDGEFVVPGPDQKPEPATPGAEPAAHAEKATAAAAQPGPGDEESDRVARALNRGSYARKTVTHPPTGEQAAIVDAVKTGDGVVISAGAGTGKTTTLKLIGQESERQRGLYVAYNTAIVADAKKGFRGSGVTVSTAHALAMAAVGHKYRSRLNGARVPAQKVARILGINEPLKVDDKILAPAQVARLVMETTERFCRSADPELDGYRHIPRKPGLDTPGALSVLRSALMPWARKAWADLITVDDPILRQRPQLRFSHDVYLKLFQLSGPDLAADYILFDEAQDADPVILSIVLDQKNSQLVAVGDKNQAIYEWRGAVNAMDGFPAKHRLALSQSFRFGPAIAHEANKWLEILSADLRLTGSDRISSMVRPIQDANALLCRTNAQAISEAMHAIEAGHKAALVGGGNDIRALADAAGSLKAGRGTSHPELFAFRTWAEVQDHAENDPSGSDLKVLVGLIDEHGPERIIEVVDQLSDESAADVTISTAHKAKGREWDSVRIASDFRPPKGDKDDPDSRQIPPEMARLAYVAVTRSRLSLDRTGLAWVDDYLPERGAA